MEGRMTGGRPIATNNNSNWIFSPAEESEL